MKKRVFIIIGLMVILVIGLIGLAFLFKKKKDTFDNKAYVGVWKHKQKIEDITGVKNGKVEVSNGSDPYYLIFNEDNTMYAILDGNVSKSNYGPLNDSANPPKEIGTYFMDDKYGSVHCPLEDGLLKCDFYAYFEKVK